MSTAQAQPTARKILVSFWLALSLCLPAGLRAAQPAPGNPDYLVTPDYYRDNYILTQLFYSAFSVNDLTPMQQVVDRGMQAYPEEFPRFMALTLELLKKPDARLFMLLAPLAPYVADPDGPAHLESVIQLTDIIAGRGLPGGRPGAPSLKSRIKFYEDTARVVRRPDPSEAAPPVPGERDSGPEAPPGAPAYIEDGESFSFTRNNGLNTAIWTRSGPDGRRLISRAVDSPLPDGATWGGVYTNFAGQSATELAFFLVRDGIITFALPKGINEGDFYADERPRPHQIEETGPKRDSRQPEGAQARPCAMRVTITPRDDAMPPELTVRLEQSNAGAESSDFICRPQCVLNYAWGEDGYALSGKSCTESGWGVWPYSDERYYGRPAAPNPAGRAGGQPEVRPGGRPIPSPERPRE